MPVQYSLSSFCFSAYPILSMQLFQFLVYGSTLLAIMMVALESHLVGYVRTTTSILSPAGGYTYIAPLTRQIVKDTPDSPPIAEGPPDYYPIAEGPADSPVAEGPADSPVLSGAL